MATWLLTKLMGMRSLLLNGVPLPDRPAMNLSGSGLSAVDNPTQNRWDVSFSATAAGVQAPTPSTIPLRSSSGQIYAVGFDAGGAPLANCPSMQNAGSTLALGAAGTSESNAVRVVTPDVTPTALLAFTLPTGTCAITTTYGMALIQSGSLSGRMFTWEIQSVLKNPSGTILSLPGTFAPNPPILWTYDETGGALDATSSHQTGSISGSTITLEVIGIASTQILWAAWADVKQFPMM